MKLHRRLHAPMSSRAWVAAIAFGLALGASALHAQQADKPAIESDPIPSPRQEQGAPASENDAALEADRAPEFLPALQGIESAIRDLIADENEIERQRQVEREARDLGAQENMALWAERMGWAAIASLVLTTVGVLLIWRTLHHTRIAAEHAGGAVTEAKNATVAAQAAVAVTREMGEAQIRAYLYCKSAKYKRTKDAVTAIIEIANAGQSPASDVTVNGTAHVNWIGGTPQMPRVHSWVYSEEQSHHCQPIPTNGSTIEEVMFWLEDDFSSLFDEDERELKVDTFKNGNEIGFDFLVRWKDVFEQRHIFTVSLYAFIDAGPSSPNKKRSTAGTLYFRMEDARHRVEGETDIENVAYQKG